MTDQQDREEPIAAVTTSLLALFNQNIKRNLEEIIDGLIEEYTCEFQDDEAKEMRKVHLRSHICKVMISHLEK